MDKQRIATIRGTMLTPGVSRNGRLYTPGLIAKAAKRMQERLADPNGLPIVMRTHHDARDDSVRIIGALRSVKLAEDGSAQYAADLFDTKHGRDIATLVIPEKGQPPALRSVSIHGYWLGPVKRVQHEDESVTTADDLEIDAVDMTGSPGVIGATISSASWVRPHGTTESVAGRTPISESVQATVEAITEEAPADAGTMKNAAGDPSDPIKSKSDLRKAIRAVGRGGADHDKIRAHIMARAKALGLTSMIPDNWKADGSMKENTTRVLDVREYYPDGPGGEAGFCIDAYNGPISLTMRACGIDPAELRVITAAAMTAAVDALQAMDPDMDADIDVANGEGDTASPDDDMESVRAGALTMDEHRADMGVPPLANTGDQTIPMSAPNASPATPAEETTDTTLEVPAVSEPTTPAAETASTLTTSMIALTEEQFTQLLDRITPARETAPAAAEPTTETTTPAPAPVAETDDQRVAQLIAEGVKAAKDELREQLLRDNGLPPRTGYRVHESEQPAADKEDVADLYKNRAEILLGSFGRTPQPAQ